MAVQTDFTALKEKINQSSGACFVLCDSNSYQFCYDIFCQQVGKIINPIVVNTGEEHKNIETCIFIWQKLIEYEAAKDSLLINLGGGAISDLGAFAAATYKRGIAYINVPTTLLAMVDAAIGGKNGINFNQYKNIIGTILLPEFVVIYTPFLQTLAPVQIKNGYVEMFKHALLQGASETENLIVACKETYKPNLEDIIKSISFKEKITSTDLQEKSIRKILNLGHTVGHAIEYAAQKNKQIILHGHAVALGIISSLKLSVLKCGFSPIQSQNIITFLQSHYPTEFWMKAAEKEVLSALIHDKKNNHRQVNMVLLEDFGRPVYNVVCSTAEIQSQLPWN